MAGAARDSATSRLVPSAGQTVAAARPAHAARRRQQPATHACLPGVLRALLLQLRTLPPSPPFAVSWTARTTNLAPPGIFSLNARVTNLFFLREHTTARAPTPARTCFILLSFYYNCFDIPTMALPSPTHISGVSSAH